MFLKKQTNLFFSFLFFLTILQGQNITISGLITDSKSNESLIGVSVYEKNTLKGVVTNQYGFYSLNIPKGNYIINYSYLGYETQNIVINATTDITQNIFLQPKEETLSEVLIENDPKQINIQNSEMSVNKLSIKTIKELPVVLGEVDVIKALLQLPGVTNAGEAASGFNVRGGAADQNLILLDEVTLFSSSHLFGLFSIFNPDAIKDLTLYKGGIPSRFGGRISSVLDIYQREGNSNEYHAEGGIGLLSSRLLVEGPIKKSQTSFLVGGRASYLHLFLPLLDIDSKALFYDLNLKLNHRINDNNSLYLSAYFGNDFFSIDDQFLNQYGNRFVNLRWNHVFGNQLFSNASLIYSKYDYNLELDFVGFEWNSGIENYNFKYDLVHYLNNETKLRYGTNQLLYDFNPGKIQPNTTDSNIKSQQLTKKLAYESGYYIEAETKLNKKININAGLRFSSFIRFGQDSIPVFRDNKPVVFNENLGIYEEGEILSNQASSRSKILSDFLNLEPRFSLSYNLNETTSLKASYQRTTQYIHLISNTTSPTPLDIWEPSGPFVKPQLSNQYALGYFKSLKDETYSFSIETYFKDLKNRINFIDGANLIANENIESVLLSGRGRSYGLEFLLQKTKGNFKGWLAYTLSRTEQQIKGRTDIEPGLNNGKWFVTNFDKTHDLSINSSYRFSKQWKINASFNFQSGLPTTFPSGQYSFFGELVIPDFEERNSSRLPNYHRMDVAFNYTPNSKKDKKWKSEWVFGIYNIYNRKNAASISFSQNSETKRNEATRLAIFGIVPSVTYNFKF